MIQKNRFHSANAVEANPSSPAERFSPGLATRWAVQLAALGLATGLVGGCAEINSMTPSVPATTASGPDGKPAETEKAFNRFPDIPVPTQSKMDVRRTLVFGGNEDWYGQLGLNTKHDGNSMFDFYKQELPNFGWEEITSVRAPVSVLTYMRAERVLSIQVEKGNLTGSTITLTVSPRGGTAPK